MGKKDFRIKFAEAQVGTFDEKGFLIEIPEGIKTRDELFNHFAKAGEFPSYFGWNWDAFLDMLRDFSWVTQKTIILWHKDLPMNESPEFCGAYVQILATVLSDYAEHQMDKHASHLQDCPYFRHELIIIFPEKWKASIEEILALLE